MGLFAKAASACSGCISRLRQRLDKRALRRATTLIFMQLTLQLLLVAILVLVLAVDTGDRRLTYAGLVMVYLIVGMPISSAA